MRLSIDLDHIPPSPFQQEPHLIGYYHWPQSIRSMHRHADYIEINFLLSGSATYVIANHLYHAQEGDILVYDSGVLHDENLTLGTSNDNCCIAMRGLQLPYNRLNALLSPKDSPRISCQDIEDELKGLYRLVEQNIQDEYHVANAAALTITHLVYTQLRKRAQETTPKENQLVTAALNYISAHYQENLHVTDIAKAIHVSPDYLTHTFRKMTNYTPSQYIQRRRIGKAQSLLIYSDLPLMEIAARIGFDDSNYFSRVFHKITGTSPIAFRKNWHKASKRI